MPVWHASLSRLGPSTPGGAYRHAHRLLAGVGGDTEWWLYNRRSETGLIVAHLRIAVTVEEFATMPNPCTLADAGNAGTQRRRGTVYQLSTNNQGEAQ